METMKSDASQASKALVPLLNCMMLFNMILSQLQIFLMHQGSSMNVGLLKIAISTSILSTYHYVVHIFTSSQAQMP